MIPIFIVRYGNPEVEDRCIEAVKKYAGESRGYPFVVYDNASEDLSLATLWNKLVYFWFEIGAGANTPDPAFVLLNTDCFLQSDITLPAMKTALYAHPRHGFAGPMTDHAGSRQSIADETWKSMSGAENLGDSDGPFAGKVFRGDYLSGFCLMVRLAAFLEAGRFPEDAPFYGQESGLIHKALIRGWTTVMCLDQYVEHLGGATCQKYMDQATERERGGAWFRDFTLGKGY